MMIHGANNESNSLKAATAGPVHRAVIAALIALFAITEHAGATAVTVTKSRGKGPATAGKEQPKQTTPTGESDEKRAEWIEKTLDYGVQDERMLAINRIPLIKNDSLRARLTKKLIDMMHREKDSSVLLKALTVLSEMKEERAAPLMIENLDHLSEDVRTGAVYGLKNIHALSAKPRLIQSLRDSDLGELSNLTNALIETLGEFEAVEAVPFAKEAIINKKTHLSNRQSLVLFLGRVRSMDAKDLLLKIYGDEEEDVTLRAYAVNSLSKLGEGEFGAEIKRVLDLIESYDVKKRTRYNTLHLYSIAALARMGDPEAVPKLIDALRSNSAQMRLKAISLIKDFKEKRTIDILKYKMNYDQNAKVRDAAKKALEEMGVDVKEAAK